MTLLQNNFFDDLQRIDELCNRYKGMSSEQIMTEAVKERLLFAMSRYKVELDEATNYLSDLPASYIYKAVAERQKEQYKQIEPLVDAKVAKRIYLEEHYDDPNERFERINQHT